MKRTMVILSSACLLAGCAADSGNLTDRLNKRFTSHTAEEFFTSYGQPTKKVEATGSGKTYHWISVEPYDQPGTLSHHYRSTPSGMVAFPETTYGKSELMCELDITTDAKNVIQHIAVTRDTQGKWSNSNCNEIFGTPALDIH